jgi:hypothetical protein
MTIGDFTGSEAERPEEEAVASMIPYDDITATGDRRWTFRLLDRLSAPDVSNGEREDLVRAFQALSDPRSFATLEGILTDKARPAGTREAAGSALRGLHHVALDVPAGKLRRWWLEGDALLRRHALLSMNGFSCPDIVVQVAADPTHLLQAEALDCMEWWFDLPRHEAITIAGLSHPDPKVRTTAASVLLWDEPVAAEEPLIRATSDPVPEVAAEAAKTLEYYPTLQVIRRLHDLLGHADAKVREEARDSLASIRSDVLIPLGGKDRRMADHIRRWLRPVWNLLAFTDEELRPDENKEKPPRSAESKGALPLAELLAMLADPDVSPLVLGDRLRSNDWSLYGEEQRRRLRPVLLSHPDQLVRDQGAWAFADWQDAGGLLELVRDADFCVRKSAMYHLGQLPPTPGIAGLAWEHLHRADTLGVHATETLETFVRHADRAVTVRQLGTIAGDHGRREGLRTAAVYHLKRLGAAEELRQLAGQLLEPPAVTWALHLSLLQAVVDLGLPVPDIQHLREVDNLYMQEAVARIEGKGK